MNAPNPPAPSGAQVSTEAGAVSSPPSNTMPRVALAGLVGTVIEFYDFIIYGTAAALVFAHAFFPALGTASGTVVSFATLGVAFVARPVGAVLFGHFGDRLGRKKTLIATMTTMGLATVLIGLLPTADTAGIIAPVALVVLRVGQGLAAGGEWAGAALLLSEHAPTGRRGFWTMFNNLGGAVANMLALSTFFITSLVMTDEAFISYGWRIPFLISIVFVIFGLWVRLRLDETPVFQNEVERRGASSLPFKEALRTQWKHILLGAGTLVMAFAFNYMGASYLTNYGTTTLSLGKSAVLGTGVFGGLMLAVGIISGGILSDRFGRRRVLIAANVVSIPWAVVLFPLLNLKSLGTFWVGLSITFLIAGHAFGVSGSFLSELFHTRFRCTAAGLAYSLAGVVGGAVPPLVATTVISSYGGLAFGLMLAVLGVVALVCTLNVSETRGRALDEAHVEAAAVQHVR
ncbi:MFS transporter [Streptomyces sp. NPDC059092]|uniref:MFS transporter n=1 Tax=Streptomyces sp. NPDC059092 TaxID=3346725 RepID=UPI0036C2D9F1